MLHTRTDNIRFRHLSCLQVPGKDEFTKRRPTSLESNQNRHSNRHPNVIGLPMEWRTTSGVAVWSLVLIQCSNHAVLDMRIVSWFQRDNVGLEKLLIVTSPVWKSKWITLIHNQNTITIPGVTPVQSISNLPSNMITISALVRKRHFEILGMKILIWISMKWQIAYCWIKWTIYQKTKTIN